VSSDAIADVKGMTHKIDCNRKKLVEIMPGLHRQLCLLRFVANIIMMCIVPNHSLSLAHSQIGSFRRTASPLPVPKTLLMSSTAYSTALDGLDESSISNARDSAQTTPLRNGKAGTDQRDTRSATNRQEKDILRKAVRAEGGPFVIYTKFGAMNPYGIYYGLVSILLGIPWFLALTMYQLFTVASRGRFDRQRQIPVALNHLWGVTLMTLTGAWPKYQGLDILKTFYQQ
jgi:hypothetical protein